MADVLSVQFASVSDDPSRWAARQRMWDEQRPTVTATRRHSDFVLHAEPASDGDIMVHATTHQGQYLGSAFTGRPHPHDEHIEAAVEVHPEHRRRGVASAMYDWAEQLHGRQMRPSPGHSPLAAALWRQRGSRG